ncbi:MAG TPA: c-type cytochrome [Gammaproteobacteria bacterium]|nr:c-type cytochrome [Gammaproteobacteria bacterium]
MKRYYVCLSFAVGVLVVAAANAQSAAKATVADRVVIGSPYAIKADAEADAFVTATAEKAYAQNCASCHGADMHGKAGVPDLTDFEFIWGITGEETSDVGPVAELEQTIRYGVRNQDCPAVHDQALYGDCPDTRYSEMPAFATLGSLTGEQIRDMTEYMLSLSGGQADAAAAARGKMEFGQCVECHGPEGMGYKPYGGPDLTDDIWIYGGDRTAIAASISAGRMGRCPAWVGKLDAATIKSLAVYIWRKVQG